MDEVFSPPVNRDENSSWLRSENALSPVVRERRNAESVCEAEPEEHTGVYFPRAKETSRRR